MFRAIILPIFRSTRLCVTAYGTQSRAPEDGQNNCLKHVELSGIINKPLFFASSWLSILFMFHYIFFLRLTKQPQFIPLQNVVYFITLSFFIRKIYTFYINYVLLFKCPFPGPKGWVPTNICTIPNYAEHSVLCLIAIAVIWIHFISYMLFRTRVTSDLCHNVIQKDLLVCKVLGCIYSIPSLDVSCLCFAASFITFAKQPMRWSRISALAVRFLRITGPNVLRISVGPYNQWIYSSHNPAN